MQAHAMHQFHSHYQLIALDFICPFEYRTIPPFGWLPEIRGGVITFVTPSPKREGGRQSPDLHRRRSGQMN
jgi:hypothetical protein